MKISNQKKLIAVISITAIILGIYHIIGDQIPLKYQYVTVYISQYFLISYLIFYISFDFKGMIMISLRYFFPAYFLLKGIYSSLKEVGILDGSSIIWSYICVIIIIIASHSFSLLDDENKTMLN